MLGKIADAVKIVFQFLNKQKKTNEQKAAQKEKQSLEKKLDDACDRGTLKDLLDATAEYGSKTVKTVAVAGMLLLCGCETLNITAAKPYEGRYSTPDAAAKALEGQKLEKGESIWILTNTTLKTLLKNTERH